MVFLLDGFTDGLRDLKLSTIEGAFASIMFGGATVFLIPFAVFLGASTIEIAFITAFPALLAAWFQLLSVKLLERFKSRKKLVAFFVALQALAWLPVFIFPFLFSEDKVFWVTVFYTSGTVLGAIAGPLWQSWMRSLVPTNILGSYFGVRNAITGSAAFFSTLLFGLLLSFFAAGNAFLIFSIIFGASCMGRLLSAYLFTKTNDPKIVIEKKEELGVRDFFQLVRKTNFGFFVIYGGAMTFAISLIGPFFSFYLLKGLGLEGDYFSYTAIIASAAIAGLLSMPYWGKLIVKHGTVKVLKVSSLLLVLHPLTIIMVRSPTGLVFSEFLNGIILAGFTLSLANFIYEVSSQKKLVRFASYQAVVFGSAAFLGLMLSGYIQEFDFSFSFITSSFYLICLVSLFLRLGIYGALMGKIKEVRPILPIQSRKIVFGVLTFEPIRQVMFAGSVLFFSTGAREIGRAVRTIARAEKSGVHKVIEIEEKELAKVLRVEKKELHRLEDALGGLKKR